jgi:hypothetical protein
VKQQQNQITTLNSQVGSLQNLVNSQNNVLKYLSIQAGDVNGLKGPHILFTGVNVHIRSGSGRTDDNNSLRGLGNLILGYNETWTGTPISRTGSHNLVVGSLHSYPSYGGFVAGYQNTISQRYTSVSGGEQNTASGERSSVSGGIQNTASAVNSSVSGGRNNTASGWASSVSGGQSNKASESCTTVSGGVWNKASGGYSIVSGGYYNTASGEYSSVSGGEQKTAGTSKSWVGGSYHTP